MTDTTEQDARTPAEIIARFGPVGSLNPWGQLGEHGARQLVEALTEAGYIIVPKEPTEAQIRAGMEIIERDIFRSDIHPDDSLMDVYRAMTSAHKDAA